MNKLNYIIMNNQLLPCYFDKGRSSVTAAESKKLSLGTLSHGLRVQDTTSSGWKFELLKLAP